jgi:pSer/pThr/pTyr-binding forkhead associated (FHA) protein
MKLQLLVLTSGKQEGKKLEIKVSPFLVGREAGCHLRPASPLISKKHCAFVVKDGKVFLQDFGSTNGSIVNGNPITGEVELKDSDHVKIGPLEFQVILEKSATETAAKKPATPEKKPAPPVKKPAPVGASTGSGTPSSQSETLAEETVNQDGDSSESGDEDDIAAMLLSLGDDGSSATSGTASNEPIPDGSTVMEMPIPPEIAGEGGDKSKHQQAKEAQQNTSQAARDILSKYMRRPR